MTDLDLAELERLAKAAHKWNRRYLCIEGYAPPLPPNQPRAAMAEFREACLPSTILSLIERVRRAEDEAERLAVPVAIIEANARRAALEEAAAIAENGFGAGGEEAAAAIRDLAKEG